MMIASGTEMSSITAANTPAAAAAAQDQPGHDKHRGQHGQPGERPARATAGAACASGHPARPRPGHSRRARASLTANRTPNPQR
jgi:hypothetical protein